MIKFVFLITSLSVCATYAEAQTNNAGTVEQWNSHEATFQSPDISNPFTDITLSVTFTEGDIKTEAKSFYVGNGTLKIRFMKLETGNWGKYY